MESTRGNTHSVTFFPPGNVFFGSMISTMHPLTTNTAAVLREEAARGCPCPGAGVADERSHGWRSEVSIERAKAWRAILFGTGDAGRVDPRLAWLWAAHVGAGWQPAQVSRGGSGLPTPSRWTFVSALQASTHCMSAALRRAPIRRRRIGRGCACSHSPLEGMGSPSLSSRLNCAAANPACR